MLEVLLVSVVLSEPPAGAMEALLETFEAYREAPAMVDRLSYTVIMPGSEPHEDAFGIVLGRDAMAVTVGGMMMISRGESFYLASEDPSGRFVEVELGSGFVEGMARVMGPGASRPAPPHVYMREGAPFDETLASFGFGLAVEPELTGWHTGRFEGSEVMVFEVTCANGGFDLFVDPDTKLLTGAELRVMPPGADASAAITATMWFEPRIVETGEELVRFTTDGRQRASSAGELMQLGPQVGDEVSDLAFTTPGGETVRLSSFGGKIVVLDFWASWCGNCRMTLPVLDEVAKWAKGEGLAVEFLAVNSRDELSGARLAAVAERWWDDLGLELAWVIDPGNAASEELRASSFPTLVVLSAEGEVIYAHTGVDSKMAEHLKEVLSEAGTDP